MTCDDAERALHSEIDDDRADAALSSHLDGCAACRRRLEPDARVADALVAAAHAADRVAAMRRRSGSVALAASLAAVAVLSVRLASRPRPEIRYVIRGDPSGVVLSGPDLARRAETVRPPRRKGDRL